MTGTSCATTLAGQRRAIKEGKAIEKGVEKHTTLKASDLVKNKDGKIVSKAASDAAKKRAASTIAPWREACKKVATKHKVSYAEVAFGGKSGKFYKEAIKEKDALKAKAEKAEKKKK